MPIKVLIVLDGGYRFGVTDPPEGIPDFTYTVLVDALTGAGMQVTKAHRGTDSTADAGMSLFKFADATLVDYDVIWLIGNEGRNAQNIPPSGDSAIGGLGADEYNAISDFMDQGGGVFATGDHDSIGANLAGHITRVRAMRGWFGANDGAKPMDLDWVEANYPPISSGRADTTRPSTGSDYSTIPDANAPQPFVWFENQSDSTPQPITPVSSPAHPILRHNGDDIEFFPDHMHEGRVIGDVGGHNYEQTAPFGDTSKDEFRLVAGVRRRPEIIAHGQVPGGHTIFAAAGSGTDKVYATAKQIGILSVYEGRVAGVGRIVCGSTFHHYVDINLTGDSDVEGAIEDLVGADAVQGQGFNANMAVFDQIKAVFVNITTWLARPRPAISLILERSTFSEDEVGTPPTAFPNAILLTVDGLKPSQFPGGGIPMLGAIAGSPAWVPAITPAGGVPIEIEPTFVDSDDPGMPDRLQRFTFTYRVNFTGDAFTFGGNDEVVPVNAALTSDAVPAPLADTAWLQLIKSANPFMLDLEDGNDKHWLSSDVKVFHVIADEGLYDVDLPANATRDQALEFIRTLASTITSQQFTDLPSAQGASKLSTLDMTTQNPKRRVYNFALARVRLSSAGGDADPVRVFFRMFTTQTTAALTYNLDNAELPIEGYVRTDDADPIALPGAHNGGNDWLSFPFFSANRTSPQHDPDNVKKVEAAEGFKVFGALLDNNLSGGYLTQGPNSGGPLKTLPELLVGEHQCLVAQIEFAGAPIPDGARPSTSDKLAQRNIAMSEVANPGLDASRVAIHTFEIEATPFPVSQAWPADELLLDWSDRTPEGTVLRLHIPSWNARDVVALADRFYPRHEIEAIDAHTIELPAGGMRYVPIPPSLHRQPGVIAAEFPLGIEKGQRFDVSVRQITNRSRHARIPPPKVQKISLAQAEKLIAALPTPAAVAGAAAPAPRQGVYDLGGNKVLFTDLSYFDAVSDHALVIEHPDPETVRAATADAGRWREAIGAFQLGVPVSTRGEMLRYNMQLLSVMRWRAGQLPRRSRWRGTMGYYLELLGAKVQALGGNPFTIPATADGDIPDQAGENGVGDADGGGGLGAVIDQLAKLLRLPGCWLLILLMILLLIALWVLLRY